MSTDEVANSRSSIPGCVDAVKHGVTGVLVPARDTQVLTTALRALLRDRQMRERFCEEPHSGFLTAPAAA